MLKHAHNWKGKIVSSHGYIMIYLPDHHLSDNRGYVYEHRLVAEETLNRFLQLGEIVHHKDGDKKNNVPQNLTVMKNMSEHRREHRPINPYRKVVEEENPIIFCACGCGETRLKYDKIGRPRQYITGHYSKARTVNWKRNKPIHNHNEIIECACGCGIYFYKYSIWGDARKYYGEHWNHKKRGMI